MLETLTLSDFIPHVGSTFRVAGFDGLSFALHQANSLSRGKDGGKPSPAPSAAREPFDLIFLGPTSPILPQKIYRLESDSMSPLEIFIVPFGPYEGGIGYQAIFA